ncbi:MAG: hypothetical protein E6Q97_20900 [Desulfurellales bacterium]|nr:MAG: hypothetical protein E6Q97_20900 [Desulfurellales bacterium]
MAGDWIAMRHELLREPEVRGMAHRLGVSRQHVVGCLLAAWSLADCHSVSRDCPGDTGTTEGHLSRYTADDFDQEVGQSGFAAAMVAEGWLVVRDDGISFPKWENYNSSTAKQRLYERKKKQKQRQQSGQNRDKCPGDTGTKPGLQNRTEQNNRSNTLFAQPAAGETVAKPRKKKPLAVFDAAAIPPELNRDGFTEAWAAWLAYRAERKPAVVAASVPEIFAQAAKLGAATAASKMRHAIAQGWQGWDFSSQENGNAGGSIARTGPGQRWDGT